MAEDQNETQVEFIEPLDDARLRLECFQTIVGNVSSNVGTMTIDDAMRCAQRLYNWVMEYEDADEDVAEGDITTGEAECTRKH